MNDLLINLLASCLFAAAAFVGGWFFRKFRDRQSLSHIKRLVGRSRVLKVIVAGSHVGRFPIAMPGGGFVKAEIPTNVLSMAISEGQALGTLVCAIQRAASNVAIRVIQAADFQDDGLPFISLGGPSINPVSKKFTALYFPRFSIDYPDHVAHWDKTTTYMPEISDNKLVDDYGFVFSGSHNGTPFLLLFGVWTFGTLSATKAFLELSAGCDAYRYLCSDKPTMLVSHGVVLDYTLERNELCTVI